MSGGPGAWTGDILGPDYQALVLAVPRPDGTPRQATLVRHRPAGTAGQAEPAAAAAGAVRRPAVLYIHGWSDYFYNTGLAEFFTGHGYDFHALDLHNHGRNLVSHELGGYVDDLSDYDDEITVAHATIQAEAGAGGRDFPLLLMGHSTGGLIAALWARKYPAKVGQLVLNSPWLEIQGGAAIRRAATPLVRPVADLRPLTRMRVPERTFYWRGISDEAYGEWRVDRSMRPPQAFPVRAGLDAGCPGGAAPRGRRARPAHARPCPALVAQHAGARVERRDAAGGRGAGRARPGTARGVAG